MNRTNFECALPSKAAEHRRTPRRWRVGHSRPNFRQVLECAAAAALWISQAGSWSQCTTSKSWRFSNTCQLRVRSSRARRARSPSQSCWFQIRSRDKTTAAGLTNPAAFPWFRFAGLRTTRPTGKLFMFPMLYRKPIRLCMNRPTPDPSQEGSRHSSAPFQFPSWEGLGVGSWPPCALIKRGCP